MPQFKTLVVWVRLAKDGIIEFIQSCFVLFHLQCKKCNPLLFNALLSFLTSAVFYFVHLYYQNWLITWFFIVVAIFTGSPLYVQTWLPALGVMTFIHLAIPLLSLILRLIILWSYAQPFNQRILHSHSRCLFDWTQHRREISHLQSFTSSFVSDVPESFWSQRSTFRVRRFHPSVGRWHDDWTFIIDRFQKQKCSTTERDAGQSNA